MTLTVEDCLAAITSHTRGLAGAAEGNLDVRIEHCPDWSMADLVWHLTSVHWFWNQVATLLPRAAPEDLERPERPADDALIAALLAGVATLTDTLRSADQQARCWTWGLEENVWFITRHQVQEAAVHHWDAVNAAGVGSWSMDDLAATDAVEEFLTQSVSNSRWPNPDAAPLGAALELSGPTDWRITDGAPGTLAFDHGPVSSDAVGPVRSADVLLWLYRRTPSSASTLPDEDDLLAQRFRAFTNTD
jgi:uncharacterized protein (TIGR03083 family)